MQKIKIHSPFLLLFSLMAILSPFLFLPTLQTDPIQQNSYFCQTNPNNPLCNVQNTTPTTSTTTNTSGNNNNGGGSTNGSCPFASFLTGQCAASPVSDILCGQDPFQGATPTGTCGQITTQMQTRLQAYQTAQSCLNDLKDALTQGLKNLQTDIQTLQQNSTLAQFLGLQKQLQTCQDSLKNKCCPKTTGGGGGDNSGAACSSYIANCNTSGGTWVSYSYGCSSGDNGRSNPYRPLGDSDTCNGPVQDWKKLGGTCSPDCGGVCYQGNNAIDCYPYGGPTLQSLQSCVSCNGTFPQPSTERRFFGIHHIIHCSGPGDISADC